MRVARFEIEGQHLYGVLEGRDVGVLSSSPFAAAARSGAIAGLLTKKTYRLDDVRLLPPCEPTKYVGVGLNYRATAEALMLPVPDRPLLYLRPSTGIVGTGDTVVLPADARNVFCEGELAVVIGRRCKDVAEEQVLAYIFGYAATNDLTDVDQLRSDHGNPTRAKAHDTFGPLGPWIETDVDVTACSISTRINGREIQRGTCDQMLFGIAECVSFISRLMTLLPADVVAMGAPPVPSVVAGGDVVEVTIDGIGVLSNRIAVQG